jgi:hypothetical protein
MYRRRLVALGIVATLAACGGGGGSTSAPSTAAISSGSGFAPASFKITIPSASSSALARSPKNVPAGTQSIKFTLLKTDATGITTPSVGPVYPLLSSSPGCATVQGVGVSCTIQLSAPVGTNIYLAEVFSTPDGSGTHIGSGAVVLTVAANTTNTATLTLAGPIATAYIATSDVPLSSFYSNGPTLALSPISGATYNSQTISTNARIFVVALDAQGNEIITPDTFNTPVVLTLNYIQTGYQRLTSIGRSPQGGANDPTTYAQLSTTYAYPSGGVTSASTSSGQPNISVFSPADQTVITPLSTSTGAIVSVTATVGSTAQPLDLIYTILPGSCPSGDTGSPPLNCNGPTPTPTPTATPTPTPTPTPSPTPTPTPTPSPTPLMWPNTTQQSDSAFYYPPGNYSLNYAYTPAPLPQLEFSSLPNQNLSNQITLTLSGGKTMTTGGSVTLDTSSCSGQVTVSPVGPIATTSNPISITVTNVATYALGCLINASDGTTTAPLQVYVNNYSAIVNRKKK